MTGDTRDSRYFISDLHLTRLDTPREREKQRRVRGFLRHLRGQASHLYVVGDLFDFWFEYRSAVPDIGGRVLAELAELAESGTEVVCFAGNHDWWIGDHLRQEYGLAVRHTALETQAQGRRLYISHGDVESARSWRYRMMLRVLHHPVAIWAFRQLHPDRGARLASHAADGSRAATHRQRAFELLHPAYENVAGTLFARGIDLAVFGHIHTARVESFAAGELVILGDWVNLHSYGVLYDGKFELRGWEPK